MPKKRNNHNKCRFKVLTFEGSSLKLSEYLDRWLPDIRDTVRQRSCERYEQIVRVHLKPTLGRVKLKDMTPAHARGLYREKLEGGSSPRTVQYIYTTLRKALQDAVSDGLVPRNAADGISRPQGSRRRRSTPSPPSRRGRSSKPCARTVSKPFTLWPYTVV